MLHFVQHDTRAILQLSPRCRPERSEGSRLCVGSGVVRSRSLTIVRDDKTSELSFRARREKSFFDLETATQTELLPAFD
jgi:hypothetical protein